MNPIKRQVTITCQSKVSKKCLGTVSFEVNPDDWDHWKHGDLIQNALPYLSQAEREILISGNCGPCFDQICRRTDGI